MMMSRATRSSFLTSLSMLILVADNPDLTDFRNRGGKAIVWHGWADQLISAEGTIDYYSRVQKQMGGSDKTSQFMRPFMAPGVGHCGGGSGPAPSGQQEALLAWVEDGKSRKLCLQPAAISRATHGRAHCASIRS
jgi:hypothetical protein